MNSISKINIAKLGLTITGKTPSSDFPDDFGAEYMFVTPSDSFDQKMINSTERYLSNEGAKKLSNKVLPPKSILITCIGSAMGKASMNKTSCITNQQINSIVPNGNYSPDYIYYAIKNNYRLLRNASSGSTALPILNKTDFDLLEIPIHNEKTTQQKIASVLSSLDSKIELNKHINSALEAMAKTLYDYWFVQFDFPDINGKPYKTNGGKMIWNKELNRKIPEGWEVGTLNNNIELIIDNRGKTPLKLGGDWTQEEDGIIALSAKIVKGGKLVNLDQANKVCKDMYEKWMPTKLKEGDILMTSEAPLGEFYYMRNKIDYCLSQRLFAIRSDHSKVLPTYLYYELSKGHGYSQIIGSSSGSTVFGIRQDVLREIKILKPNLSIQKKFEDVVAPLLLLISKNDEQNQQLSSLRDWLLPMLMNGQVKVKDKVVDALLMAAESVSNYKR